MKRSSFVLASLLLAGAACSGKPKLQTIPPRFSYHGEYYPSFIPSCTITITAQDTVRRIALEVYAYRDTVQTVAFARSAPLSAADLTYFFAKLGSVQLLKVSSTDQPGLDGITVDNTVTEGSHQHKFHFWSPSKSRDPQQHQVVEAVLGLYRRKFQARQAVEYVESLEQYFDFGLPCQVTRRDPYEVRLYGHLSSDEESALTEFVYQLPTNQPILIDVTNFGGMGTMFYPLFRSLLARNPHIVWVVNPASRNSQLQEIGVAASRMTTSTAAGRALVQQLTTP